MLGGQDENKGTLSSGEKYDPDTNSWSSLPPMNEARSLSNCWDWIFLLWQNIPFVLQDFILDLWSLASYPFKIILWTAFCLYPLVVLVV